MNKRPVHIESDHAWTTTSKGSVVKVSLEDLDLIEKHSLSESKGYPKYSVGNKVYYLSCLIKDRIGLASIGEYLDRDICNVMRDNLGDRSLALGVPRNKREVHLEKDYAWTLTDKGNVVKVSLEDIDLIKRTSWSENDDGYCCGSFNRKSVKLHAIVAKRYTKDVCDHINRNRLDNRRENLRPATFEENSHNSGMKSTNKSGYKGVSRLTSGKWQASIGHRGKQYYLGCYADKKKAAQAYNQAASQLFGEFAFLNPV